jgi:hypothetical protein
MKTQPLIMALLIALIAASCSARSVEPLSQVRDVVYVVGESPTIFVVDPNAGRVLAQPSAPPGVKFSPALSGDSSTLFFTSYQPASAIYSLRAPDYTLNRWLDIQLPIGNPVVGAPIGSLWMSGFEIAFAPGRDELFGSGTPIGDSVVAAETPCCLVVFDTLSRKVKASISVGGFKGLTTLPAGPIAPSGGLIATVYSPYDRDVFTRLAVVDPTTRRAFDSLVVPRRGTSTVESVQSFVVAPGGRLVYILGWYGVYAFDLVTRQLAGFLDTSANDMDFGPHLAVSPDASTVYLTTVFETPYGTTRPPTTIRVFDANLIEKAPIALAKQFGTRTPIFHDLVVSRDGRSLYLLAGNRDFFGEGTDRVMVLDLHSGRVTRVVDLGVYAQAQLLLGHD